MISEGKYLFDSREELLCGNLDNDMSYVVIVNPCCIANAFINASRPIPGRREKTFIKPFEVPQRSVNFQKCTGR